MKQGLWWGGANLVCGQEKGALRGQQTHKLRHFLFYGAFGIAVHVGNLIWVLQLLQGTHFFSRSTSKLQTGSAVHVSVSDVCLSFGPDQKLRPSFTLLLIYTELISVASFNSRGVGKLVKTSFQQTYRETGANIRTNQACAFA